ncbi:MAG: HEPN domain-containing protein [Phycisphaerae bacterium]
MIVKQWGTISLSNYNAAKAVIDISARSCVSRAYFAAFSALTGLFRHQQMVFVNGGDSPRHRDVTLLIGKAFSNGNLAKRLKRAVRALYKLRLMADYSAGQATNRQSALQALRFSMLILRECGVVV